MTPAEARQRAAAAYLAHSGQIGGTEHSRHVCDRDWKLILAELRLIEQWLRRRAEIRPCERKAVGDALHDRQV